MCLKNISKGVEITEEAIQRCPNKTQKRYYYLAAKKAESFKTFECSDCKVVSPLQNCLKKYYQCANAKCQHQFCVHCLMRTTLHKYATCEQIQLLLLYPKTCVICPSCKTFNNHSENKKGNLQQKKMLYLWLFFKI